MKIEKGKVDYQKLVSDILADSWNYLDDIKQFEHLSLLEFYNFVLNLQFISDGKETEILSRPKFSLDAKYKLARDCDDKTLAMVTYYRLKKIPFRIVVSGRKNKPHHIYTEIMMGTNYWYPMDATYPKINKPGERLFPEIFREIYID